VLKHHYPGVHNFGDFTGIQSGRGVDLLVGGTPCQAFSLAGSRGGATDLRGHLTLEFWRLAGRIRPRWIVWENVPGVLSIHRGRLFGALLGALAKLGYGFAYRILDAQFYGVPQRRRRVFVVAHLGDWRGPAAVLFERESLRWNPTAGEAAAEEIADALAAALVSVAGIVTPTARRSSRRQPMR
jgi:DNA (cytosine-5)-methyltransferase 1